MGAFDDLIPQSARGPAGGGVNAATRGAAMAKLAASRQLRDQLKTVQGLYGKTLKGGGIGALMEYLPTPANKKFNAAADGLLPLARQAFRVPGSGAESDRELDVLVRSLLPRHTEYDSVNEQRMSQLGRMIEGTEREWGPIAGMPAPAAQPSVIDFNDLPE